MDRTTLEQQLRETCDAQLTTFAAVLQQQTGHAGDLQLRDAAADSVVAGPGHLVLIQTDSTTVALAVPKELGWSPAQDAEPTGWQPLVDATTTLLPETWTVRETHVLAVRDLRATLGDRLDQSAMIALAPGEPPQAAALLIAALDVEPLLRRAAQPAPGQGASGSPPGDNGGDQRPQHSPAYARSLLKIQVPLTVTLAETRHSVQSILQLGPGAIIQFRKSCDETLSLEAAGQQIAQGEAVKVGENFGLFITQIARPRERFAKVSGRVAQR